MQLAIFDLDNTLLAGDSDYQWGQYLIEIGVLNAAEHSAANEQFYADYKVGKLDIVAFLAFQLKPLSQYPRTQLDAWRAEYMAQKVRPMMTQKAHDKIAQHRAQGDQLLIITATNSFVTRPIASAYGIQELIGTDPEEINGQFTGNIAGIPSFKEGKITRLMQWLEARGETLQSYSASWFYSDSQNDLPLLGVVDHPVAVDPDPVLKAHAEAHGWPVISLR